MQWGLPRELNSEKEGATAQRGAWVLIDTDIADHGIAVEPLLADAPADELEGVRIYKEHEAKSAPAE